MPPPSPPTRKSRSIAVPDRRNRSFDELANQRVPDMRQEHQRNRRCGSAGERYEPDRRMDVAPHRHVLGDRIRDRRKDTSQPGTSSPRPKNQRGNDEVSRQRYTGRH